MLNDRKMNNGEKWKKTYEKKKEWKNNGHSFSKESIINLCRYKK